MTSWARIRIAEAMHITNVRLVPSCLFSCPDAIAAIFSPGLWLTIKECHSQVPETRLPWDIQLPGAPLSVGRGGGSSNWWKKWESAEKVKSRQGWNFSIPSAGILKTDNDNLKRMDGAFTVQLYVYYMCLQPIVTLEFISTIGWQF